MWEIRRFSRNGSSIILSETEREQIIEEADYYGMKESKYIRRLITHCGMVDMDVAKDRRR